MIPTKSTTPIIGDWVEVQNSRITPLLDYEEGGFDLLQPSENNYGYLWEATSDGTSIWVGKVDEDKTLLVTDTNITQIALAFDATMRPHIAYMSNGVCKFWHFDSIQNQMVTTTYPGAVTPRVCTDDKRSISLTESDLLISYMKGQNLYLRAQRDRYSIEYLIASNTGGSFLTTFGMNKANRLQWKIRPN